MSGSPLQTPIAIVGIGCRFPGGVVDPASFWRLLSDGTDAITRDAARSLRHRSLLRSASRDPRADHDAVGRLPRSHSRSSTRRSSASLREKPSASTRSSGCCSRPRGKRSKTPAWTSRALEGSPTGVFVGQWLSDFEARLFADPEDVDFYMTTGSGRYSASGRISYALGLRGAEPDDRHRVLLVARGRAPRRSQHSQR